jgi:hypothetical protein
LFWLLSTYKSKKIKTSKAIRAVIQLGAIKLDGYQIPDGCYKLAKNQAAAACNLSWKRYAELWEVKHAEKRGKAGSPVFQNGVESRHEWL